MQENYEPLWYIPHPPAAGTKFEDICVQGTATGQGWEGLINLEEHPGKEGVWTTQLKLELGKIRFRSQEFWKQNWEGTTFPKGEAK